MNLHVSLILDSAQLILQFLCSAKSTYMSYFQPSILCSLSLYNLSIQLLELLSFVLLKRFSWLRVRYESMTEIHPFFLFSILIIWLVVCRLHRKSDRFDLISKTQNLSISYHATWFTTEFVKAQTLMSILCHSKLVVYWCLAHTKILSCLVLSIFSSLEWLSTYYISGLTYVNSLTWT